MEIEKFIGRKIDYNTNDFELVAAVRDVAKLFADKVTTLRHTEKDFDVLFPKADENATYLGGFTGAVSEANYIDKAVAFLEVKDTFLKALQEIEKVEKFSRNNLPKVKEWKLFISEVQDELTKAAIGNINILQLKADFESHLTGDVIKNFTSLQQSAQKTKDEYHQLFSAAMKDAAAKYTEIEVLAVDLINEIETLPIGLNDLALSKVSALKQYARQRTNATVTIDFDVKDKQSRFTYSEVLSFIDLYPSKKAEIEIAKASLIKTKAPEPPPGTPPTPTVKKYAVKMPTSKMKVAEYKNWLQGELQKLASAFDNDEIEIS